MRFAARQDMNHSRIFGMLRGMGYAVLDLSRLGGGTPDGLVSFGDFMQLFEVKMEDGKLTDDQVDFFSKWAGQHGKEIVIFRKTFDVKEWHEKNLQNGVFGRLKK